MANVNEAAAGLGFDMGGAGAQLLRRLLWLMLLLRSLQHGAKGVPSPPEGWGHGSSWIVARVRVEALLSGVALEVRTAFVWHVRADLPLLSLHVGSSCLVVIRTPR
jgi:hypothetical protein